MASYTIVCGSANFSTISRLLIISIVYSLCCSLIWIAVTETTLVINHSRNKNINQTWTQVECEVTNIDVGYTVEYFSLPSNTTVKATITTTRPPGATSYSVGSNATCIVDPKEDDHVYFNSWMQSLLDEYQKSIIRAPFFIVAIVLVVSIGIVFSVYVSSIACCQSTSRIENIIANKLRHNALLATSVDLSMPTNQDFNQELPKEYFNWVSLYVSLTGKGNPQIAGTVSTSLERNQAIVKVFYIMLAVATLIVCATVIYLTIFQDFESSFDAIVISSMVGEMVMTFAVVGYMLKWIFTSDRNSYIVIFYDQILWIRKNALAFLGAPKFIITCSNLPDDKPRYQDSAKISGACYLHSGPIRCAILNSTKQTIEDILSNISL